MIYPNKQGLIKPEEGAESSDDDGEKFWQSFFSYFSGGCDSGLDDGSKKVAIVKRIIEQPVPIAAANQSDKIVEKPNAVTENKIEQKPFYFVIPPRPSLNNIPGGLPDNIPGSIIGTIPGNFPGLPGNFPGLGTFPGRPIFQKFSVQPGAQLTSLGSQQQENIKANGFQ